VERAHTKSLDANDKLIQTRSHVRDTTASRKQQVRMRKVKSTIVSSEISDLYFLSIIVLLRAKEQSLAITFLMCVLQIKTFWLDVRYPQQLIVRNPNPTHLPIPKL